MNKLIFVTNLYDVTFYYLVDYISLFIFNFSHDVENRGLTWEIFTYIQHL